MFERRFPRAMGSLEDLFASLREFLAAEGLDEARAFPLELVAEELFTNIVRHSAGAGEVGVELTHSGTDIRLTLRAASGTPFDPTLAPEAALDGPIEQRKSGGMGIHLVRSLAATLDYRRDGVDDVITAILRTEA